jgi:transcriptional regulator with XRE-family HTH domain
MVDQDLDELRRLLREAVEAARASMHTRDIEAALGVGHGNLERLLNGTLELRVRHLLGFARLLEIPPADFFELGCAKAAAAAQHRLLDWLGPDRRRAQGSLRLPSNPEELAELIRSAVREELAAREGGSGGNEPRRR